MQRNPPERADSDQIAVTRAFEMLLLTFESPAEEV